MTTGPVSPELLEKMDAYWRAANYLSVGQIYLYENPLLKKPLELAHVKPLVALPTCGGGGCRGGDGMIRV
jgi:xylulose-5-phosphate/fructose-6-phosphate phosphoketolase